MKVKLTSVPLLVLSLFFLFDVKQARAQVFCTISYVQNECCNGGNNGYITSMANSGTSPYTYLWNPSGETTATAIGLTAGTYTVVVTDALSNTSTCAATITQPTQLTANVTFQNNNTSCLNPNGSTSVMASGGTFPYSYTWTPSGQTTSSATGLAAGTYTCNVTDNNCCLNTVSVIIGGTAAPMVTLTTTPDTVPCNGTATAIATGGVSPYTYRWSPGGKTTATITALCAGTYCCRVTDHSGCQDSNCVAVLGSRVVVACACSSVTTFVPQPDLSTLQVNVYPNPAYNMLTVIMNGTSGQANFYLTDMLGRQVTLVSHHQVNTGSKISMNIESLLPGIYFLTIEANGQRLVKKVTKL